MQKITLLALCLTLILADRIPKTQDNSDYEAWKAKHGMKFDESEDRYRLFLYRQKQAEIKAHNANSAHGWKKAENMFAAHTMEELESAFLKPLFPGENGH